MFFKIRLFIYPPGKSMTPHLLRCQGLAVVYYGFTLGRLGPGASSTFAQLRYNQAVRQLTHSSLAPFLGILRKFKQKHIYLKKAKALQADADSQYQFTHFFFPFFLSWPGGYWCLCSL